MPLALVSWTGSLVPASHGAGVDGAGRRARWSRCRCGGRRHVRRGAGSSHHREGENHRTQSGDGEDRNPVPFPVRHAQLRGRRGDVGRRRRRRDRHHQRRRDRRRDDVRLELDVSGKLIEAERKRRFRRVFSRCLRFGFRRDGIVRLDQGFAPAVPADREQPVFERMVTMGTTLHGSSHAASAAARVIGAMPVPRLENGLRRLFNPPLAGRSWRPAEAPFRARRSQKRHPRSMFVASATKAFSRILSP